MDSGATAGLVVVGLMGLVVLYFIGYIIYLAMKIVFVGVPTSMSNSRLDCTKNYKLPNSVKSRSNIHKSYDYWDDAGDGSGVNYVTMPNGDVRID